MFPHWTVIEKDFEILRATGEWRTPQWATEVLKNAQVSGIHGASQLVVESGLKEIIRQLKEERSNKSLCQHWGVEGFERVENG